MLIKTATLGYPRIGSNREQKFALEKFWKGTIAKDELLAISSRIEQEAWNLQRAPGLSMIDYVTVGDHYLYDMVLTWCENLNLCPHRFRSMEPGLPRMFAMARGVDGAEALSKYEPLISYYCLLSADLTLNPSCSVHF